MGAKTFFITGTDTGVGKTLVTGLLLYHLRRSGCHALAMKPFCSGSLADVEFLCALQDGEVGTEDINPFYFSEPLAPLVAARLHCQRIPLRNVLESMRLLQVRCQCLLIEGSGGLLTPLGEGQSPILLPDAPASDSAKFSRLEQAKAPEPAVCAPYTALDVISQLNCEVIIVARNRLGVINHTLLTFRALETGLECGARIRLVLSSHQRQDSSSSSNPSVLAELLAPAPVFTLPFLGRDCCRPQAMSKLRRKLKRTLEQILTD